MRNYILFDRIVSEALHTLLEHYNVCEGPEYHFHDEVVPKTSVLRLKVHNLTGKKRNVAQQQIKR